MQKIIDAVRKALGFEETVDTIVSPFSKITRKLDAHEVKQIDVARRRRIKAEAALAEAIKAERAAEYAAQQRGKISQIFA